MSLWSEENYKRKNKNLFDGRANIRFRDNQDRTDDFHHVKVILYHWVISLPSSGRKTNWLIITYQRVERLTTTIPLFYFEQLEARPSFHTTTKRKNEKEKIGYYSEWILSKIVNTIFKNQSYFYIFLHSKVPMCFHPKMNKFLFSGTRTYRIHHYITEKRRPYATVNYFM